MTKSFINNGKAVPSTIDINQAQIRTEPIGYKYSLVNVGNEHIEDEEKKLSPEELALVPDIMQKPGSNRIPVEQAIAAKADFLSEFARNNPQWQEEAAKLRDGEYCPPSEGVNAFGYDQAQKLPSHDYQISKQMIALQYSGGKTLEDAVEALKKSELSVHFVIEKDGSVHQLVDTYYRAYSVGVGNFTQDSFLYPKYPGEQIPEKVVENNLNSFAISVMHINNGMEYFSSQQIRASCTLINDLCEGLKISQNLVIGHSDWTPFRMTSPGPYFDWQGLSKNDIGILPADHQDVSDTSVLLSWKDIGNLNAGAWENVSTLSQYGYYIPQSDIAGQIMTDSVGKALLAFRTHFSGKEILADPDQKEAWDTYIELSKTKDPKAKDSLKELAIFTEKDAAKLNDIISKMPAAQADADSCLQKSLEFRATQETQVENQAVEALGSLSLGEDRGESTDVPVA